MYEPMYESMYESCNDSYKKKACDNHTTTYANQTQTYTNHNKKRKTLFQRRNKRRPSPSSVARRYGQYYGHYGISNCLLWL